MPEAYEIRIKAYDDIGKDVGRASDRAGNIYVPKEWIGKKVRVILVEPLDETPRNP